MAIYLGNTLLTSSGGSGSGGSGAVPTVIEDLFNESTAGSVHVWRPTNAEVERINSDDGLPTILTTAGAGSVDNVSGVVTTQPYTFTSADFANPAIYGSNAILFQRGESVTLTNEATAFASDTWIGGGYELAATGPVDGTPTFRTNAGENGASVTTRTVFFRRFESFTATAGQTEFDVGTDFSSTAFSPVWAVKINGTVTDDFTTGDDGNGNPRRITLTTGAAENDVVTVIYFDASCSLLDTSDTFYQRDADTGMPLLGSSGDDSVQALRFQYSAAAVSPQTEGGPATGTTDFETSQLLSGNRIDPIDGDQYYAFLGNIVTGGYFSNVWRTFAIDNDRAAALSTAQTATYSGTGQLFGPTSSTIAQNQMVANENEIVGFQFNVVNHRPAYTGGGSFSISVWATGIDTEIFPTTANILDGTETDPRNNVAWGGERYNDDISSGAYATTSSVYKHGFTNQGTGNTGANGGEWGGIQTASSAEGAPPNRGWNRNDGGIQIVYY